METCEEKIPLEYKIETNGRNKRKRKMKQNKKYPYKKLNIKKISNEKEII